MVHEAEPHRAHAELVTDAEQEVVGHAGPHFDRAGEPADVDQPATHADVHRLHLQAHDKRGRGRWKGSPGPVLNCTLPKAHGGVAHKHPKLQCQLTGPTRP